MSKIKIKNFGPIKEGLRIAQGWIDVKKVTILIGNQGSGKSTIAKLISTFIWMEKALIRGDMRPNDFQLYNRFRKKHCAYQNIHNYFRENTLIEFSGTLYNFLYEDGSLNVEAIEGGNYLLPKVMYVPAERNFVSTVSQPEKLKYLPPTLYTFLEEFERSKSELNESLLLPINNLSFKYESKKGLSKIVGEDYELLLTEASSGLQSLIPLYIVSKNLAEGINKEVNFSKKQISLEQKQKIRKRLINILTDKRLTENLKDSAVDLLSSVTKNDCFINVVEEPEQNLFPLSQRSALNSLLQFNNKHIGNKLIMTTHSPYIINYLTLAVKANKVNEKIKEIKLREKLNDIVPIESLLDSNELNIYEIDDNGTVIKLEEYNGLPSDENYLNERLAETNYLFSDLLEIEDLCP